VLVERHPVHSLDGITRPSLNGRSPRIASHLLFRHRIGSLRKALVLLGIAALVSYFARRGGGSSPRSTVRS